MPTPSYSVALTKEAFDRLCDIRDYLYDTLDVQCTMNELVSTIICQVQLFGVE